LIVVDDHPLYYGDYLQLDVLLNAQRLESGRDGPAVHDEMLFIIVHQAYELWFKQVVWELDEVRAIFSRDRVDESDMGRVVALLHRITEIQKVLLQQIAVLETMTPLDFLEFRDHLFPASGFQSVQFRMVENKLGVRIGDRVRLAGANYTARFNDEDRALVERTEQEPSLHDLVEAWLERTPFLELGDFDFWEAYRKAVLGMLDHDRAVVEANPNLTEEERAEQLAGFEQTYAHNEAVFDEAKHKALVASGERRFSYRAFQAALFITLYRDEPALHNANRVLTLLMDIDEGFTTWRHRHALMALRMIGRRVGTGGSAGFAYLSRSAEKSRVFTDLFNLATFLIPRSARPALPPEVAATMRFRFEE
jgi:tryptophan 2,3-dioxygenase